MNVQFECPGCQRPADFDLPGQAEWQCPGCDHLLHPAGKPGEGLHACAVCGNPEVYRKKDFPHWLGMSVLTVACLAFLVLNYFYLPRAAWLVLLGSAALDGLLYLWVGDAVVCYRCGACHRGVPGSAAHAPFDLGTAERYRQERLRREQLEGGKRAGA